MNDTSNDLVSLLESVLREKRLSQRALAMYAGVANSTISRIMNGSPADPETLQKLADYLNLSVESIYRLAGILPETKNHSREELKSVIEHLFGKLSPNDQAEILDIIRMKIERQKQQPQS